ncbi:MAG: hypothetical protein ACE5EV_07025 [Gaiellales bacterium]
MVRAGALLALVAALGAFLVVPTASALPFGLPLVFELGRTHRPKLPPPDLPNTMAIDEFEFFLRPSKRTVAAGQIRMRVYNRGEDDHNLVVVAKDGTEYRTDVRTGESGVLEPVLTPGRYEVYCDLFAGTPRSHRDLGMVFELVVE